MYHYNSERSLADHMVGYLSAYGPDWVQSLCYRRTSQSKFCFEAQCIKENWYFGIVKGQFVVKHV